MRCATGCRKWVWRSSCDAFRVAKRARRQALLQYRSKDRTWANGLRGAIGGNVRAQTEPETHGRPKKAAPAGFNKSRSLSPTFHVPDFPDFSWASWLSRSGPWRCQIMAELFRSSGFKNNAASVFCLLILPDSDHFGQG